MTKKSKPASLTSSLLARKGRAEPSAAPYSIPETGRIGPSPDDQEIDGLAAVRPSSNGNGHSPAGFARLPLSEVEEPRPEPEKTVAQNDEETVAQNDEVVPNVQDANDEKATTASPSFTDLAPETPAAENGLAAETSAPDATTTEPSPIPMPTEPAVAMAASAPSDARRAVFGGEGPPGDDAETAINAEREAARDARLLRFVYVMAALTGIVAIVLYAGGWFIEHDAPETAQSSPSLETLASAEPSSSATETVGTGQPVERLTAPEGGGASPAAPDSPALSIPPAPPIAAPNFGAADEKSPAIGVTTGGKPKAVPELPAEMAKKAGPLPESKPVAAPSEIAPRLPSGVASGEPGKASKETSPKGEKIAVATPPEPPKPTEPLVGKAQMPVGGEPSAKVPSQNPDAPGTVASADAPSGAPKVSSPVDSTSALPKIAEKKPAAAAKPPKKVPNLRVLAPALVRPEPTEATPPVAPKPPKLAVAKPAASKKAVGVSSGRYLVQLASVSSSAVAEKEWARLQKVFPNIFGSRELVVEKRVIAGRGTFYRVQTGRFDSLKEARSICSTLKAKKQGCLPVKR